MRALVPCIRLYDKLRLASRNLGKFVRSRHQTDHQSEFRR